MTLKMVLSEKRPRWPALTRIAPALYPQSRPLQPLSPNAPRWSTASRFAVFGRDRPLLTTEQNPTRKHTLNVYKN